MRIHVLSDLHLEFGPIHLPSTAADLVVLAGDVHTKLNGIRWIRDNIPDTPVIYLAGNHEYYGEKLPGLIDKIREETAGTNIHLLENESIELSGFRFFGATLWTDMELHGDHHIGCLEALQMNDYKRIRRSADYRKLRPVDTRALHHASVRHIENFLKSGDPRRSVVITHHAPSILSLPEHRRTEIISCAYASRLDSLIEFHEPLLWIHGHIHHSNDYRLARTRILSNPRAYVDDPNPNFNPSLIVDLADEYRKDTERTCQMQPVRVSTIDFREGSGCDLPSVEILIDGRNIAEIISPQRPDAGIPISIFTRPDLPSLFDDGHYPTPDDGERIVAVCSCGIPGCGATSAQFVIEEDFVRISLRSFRPKNAARFSTDLADFIVTDEVFWVPLPEYREFLGILWSYVTDPSHEATEPQTNQA